MGRVTVAGGNPGMKAPTTGIQAGTLAVGSVVKLMEGGTAVDYLVVNQGIPSNSSLYDASCDGTWLLRKAIHSNRVWDSSVSSAYASSAINTWLNGDFFNTLGSVEQAAIKQVKIPYCVGSGVATVNSGANGLSTKAFLLGAYELGWSTSDSAYFPVDGAKLGYFLSSSQGNSRRIAYLDGSAIFWWMRSTITDESNTAWAVKDGGDFYSTAVSTSLGIRPALVLSKTAIFDEDTLILKGAA